MSDKNVIPSSPSASDYKRDEPTDLSWTQADDPIALFAEWLKLAVEKEVNDANAMSLATVDGDGLPDVRMVLLKGFDDRGFVFYTNSESAKGDQLKEAGKAALGFHWKSVRRQVRVRGAVSKVADAESDAYFAQRARHSRIGAWASDQSRAVADRAAMMAKVKAVEDKFAGDDVPRPDHWYGWRVKPESIEFWQSGAFRIHDRIVFTPSGDQWTKQRLFP